MEPIRLEKRPSKIPPAPANKLVRRIPFSPGKKGLIKVGYACNNHCSFCHTLDIRDIDGTGPLVMKKIDRARQLGYGMVVLSGGEVTMRKELLLWAARTAALGLDFGLVTNGRMLAYPELVDKLMRLRLAYVYMSLHGGDARIHNAMVRADAFEETFGAIACLSGRGLDLTINCVVTNTNLAKLRPLVDLLLPYDDLTLKFSMTQPKGGASMDHAFRALIPDVSECGARIHDAIAYGLERVAGQGGRGPRFSHDGVPFCLLPGFESHYDDLRTHQFASMTEAFEPDYFPVDNGATCKPAACDACALRGPCPGLFSAYAEMKGVHEIKTVHGVPRSNSWTYFPDRVLQKLDGGGCPIYASPIPYDVNRTLFLDGGDHLTCYRTESRDFDDLETRLYKRELGQVYLDVSDKAAPDDFAADLRKLTLTDKCRGCDKVEHCAGTYRIVEGDPFSPSENELRARIGAVIARIADGSRVVDVGCSDDGRYGDLWAPAALAGKVRYLGLEPDQARVASLSARFPWAELRAIPVEQYAPEGELEVVLALRSWNHLLSPAEALRPLVAALRPGGTLVVVDNVAFGLVRSSVQRERAESSSAAFEHYRNDDSHAAIAALAALPLEVVAHTPITPDGSNQWIVELRRT